MKNAPHSSASARQRRGSGVFSTSPALRGADVISGLPTVSMGPPDCRFDVCSLRHQLGEEGVTPTFWAAADPFRPRLGSSVVMTTNERNWPCEDRLVSERLLT